MADENKAGDSNQQAASIDSKVGAAVEKFNEDINEIKKEAYSGEEQVQKVNREFQEKSTMARAKELGMPYVDIAKTPLNPDFLKVLNVAEAKRARVIPFFKVGKKLRIAVEGKDKLETQELFENLKEQGYDLDICLASSAGLDDAFKIYDQTQKYKKIEKVESIENQTLETYEKEIAGMKDLPEKISGLTAEQGLNLIDLSAMRTNASDIHYEPEENSVVVRFRIDGVLHFAFELRKDAYKNIADQIKYQSKMKLNVNAVPQDGRYVFDLDKNKVAVRVAAIPTPYGESFVCRYLSSDQKALTFEELGFQGLALKKIDKAAGIAQGMILVTGPTGSGKSTTLYSIVHAMNNPGNKVITLEDPVEYYMQGVTQSQIDDKGGYSFASGLKSVLRHDPDIVMLGEIRDLETAAIAAQAALTGHVLLSTLHTNSALETIPRLVNMGLKPFVVAPSLNTIVAQRLVRKVCGLCSVKTDLKKSEKADFEEVNKNLGHANKSAVFKIPEQVARVKGCEKCSNTGYTGRIVLAEVVTITSELKDLILNKASMVDLIKAARKEGMITMREDGFIKVAQGLTTLEEVYRATNVVV